MGDHGRLMRRHRGLVIMLALAGAVWLGGAGLASAEEAKSGRKVCPICGRVSDDTASYPAHAGSTLLRGAANTTLGWTELFRQPVKTAEKGGNVFTGVANGVTFGVRRTVRGVGELLTFWMPKANNHYTRFAHDCPICMGDH